MLRITALVGVALTLLACRTGTAYTPRTPGRAALGMRNGEPGIYKDGQLQMVSSTAAAAVACSPAATTTAGVAASHHADYRRNSSIGGALNALGVFFPALYPFGAYFAIRAASDQQHAHAAGVDAINLHNDDARCL